MSDIPADIMKAANVAANASEPKGEVMSAWSNRRDAIATALLTERQSSAALIKELVEALGRADAMMELMYAAAYQIGLEGTKDWDELISKSDVSGTHDVVHAAFAKAKGEV